MEKVTDNSKGYLDRMSDGRAFTDYNPNCLLNKGLAGKMDSYEYRQSLIKNAQDILLKNDKRLDEIFSCKGCNKAIIPTEKFVQSCTGGNCMIDQISENGVGIRQE